MPPAACQSESIAQTTRSIPAWERLKAVLPALEWATAESDDETWGASDTQDQLCQEIARGLFRKKPGHVLLIGASGVGKTAVLSRFATQVRRGEMPSLEGTRVVWLDVSSVDPDDSRACLELIFAATREWGRVVLCLDGIASLLRRSHGGTNKQLLRGLLQQRSLKVIGTMTPWEYAESVGPDAQMLSLFTRLSVVEPEGAELRQLVEYAAHGLADHYDVTIPLEVIERTIALTSVFLLSECQPAKSIDVLRMVCEDLCFQRERSEEHPRQVTLEAVIDVLSRKTGIPRETISGQGRECDFFGALSQSVVGQEQAVREVATELELISAGLGEPNKPASVMMFAGMTGVGKTELAKRMAELYSATRRLHVYSMGNFTESHSVSGIIGVPPGYVGHEEGGRLINELRADPYGVFLLDEAEKCHPNVWKPFLNLFDEGWIIDQRGVKAYADRAIFILTTNAGDRNLSQLVRANKTMEEIVQNVKQALSRVRHERSSQPVFPPQFLSRIKRIIVFNPLDRAAMSGIATCAAQRLCRRWQATRDKTLSLAPEVVERIAEIAFEKNEQSQGQEGGRIVQKLLSDHIESAVQRACLAQRTEYERSPVIQVEIKTLPDSTSNTELQLPVQIQFQQMNESAEANHSQQNNED